MSVHTAAQRRKAPKSNRMPRSSPHQPDRRRELTRYSVALPLAMHTSAAALADKAGKALGCKVSHSALIRAALLPWVNKAEHGPVTDTHEAIRRAEPAHGTRQRSSKPAWSNELNDAIDKLRRRLGGVILAQAANGRTALLRAALTSLLEVDEREPPAALDVIRAGLVKYGRKPKR